MGLLSPSKGEIYVNNIPSKNETYSLYPYIGYVPQDIFLLEDTLKANIAYGVDNNCVNNDKIDEVVKVADLNNFIETLPGKLEYKLTHDSTNISGGQKQRIAIARTLYTNPDILILDESTNELDIDSEKKIISKLKNLYQDKIFIVVSHRLSTLENCDELFFIERNNNPIKINNIEEAKEKLLQNK